MAIQSSSVINSEPVSQDLWPEVDPKIFKWTPTLEKTLLFSMINLKPCGINKHLNMLFIREKISKELNVHIPSKCIWNYLESKWNLAAADSMENTYLHFDEEYFDLPEDYKQLILEVEEEEEEEIKKIQEKNGINDEVNIINFSNLNKSRLKSMSLIDSTDDNETGSSSTKVNEIRLEDIPNIRRSLRTSDKSEEKELHDLTRKTNKLSRSNNKIEVKKVTDSKQLNKNFQYQSTDPEKNIVSNMKIRKRKIRNVSESSFSSDNSKQPRYFKNNLTDLNISDSSSRSVTPEMLRGKTANRSITPETMSRKTNLRSNDKDQKSKPLEKASTKFGYLDICLPEVRLERLKTEKLEKPAMESKPKGLVHNKNELKHGKNKFRGRLTSDLLVAQQSPVIQPLGRRSCSNKST